MLGLLLSSTSASAILVEAAVIFAQPMDLLMTRSYVVVQQSPPTTITLRKSRAYVVMEQFAPTNIYLKQSRAYIIVKPD